jgi:hypothetical protein
MAVEIFFRGVPVASLRLVPELTVPVADRRRLSDRRRNSRSGRRATDPHVEWHWRRLAWLFAAYALFVSARSLPASVKNYLRRPAG